MRAKFGEIESELGSQWSHLRAFLLEKRYNVLRKSYKRISKINQNIKISFSLHLFSIKTTSGRTGILRKATSELISDFHVTGRIFMEIVIMYKLPWESSNPVTQKSNS